MARELAGSEADSAVQPVFSGRLRPGAGRSATARHVSRHVEGAYSLVRDRTG
jgi:hypothetical protein